MMDAFRLRIKSSAPVIILFFLALAFLWGRMTAFNRGVPTGDIAAQFYPNKVFTVEMVKRGEIPLWNPYIFCGVPFLANPQTALFYPPNLAFLVLPVHLAFSLLELLHTFLAGLFTYLYLRSVKRDRFVAIFSAIAFAFSGYFAARYKFGHFTLLQASAWLPLIFLLFERALERRNALYIASTGVVIAIQFFAGHPTTSFSSILAVGLYSFYKIIKRGSGLSSLRIALTFLLVIFIAFLVSAIQLLPTYELLKLSTRGSVDFDFLKSRSFPPQNLLTFFVPNIFGSPVHSNAMQGATFVETCAYVGILPLLLAIFCFISKRDERATFFAILALIAIFLALGGFNPFYSLLFRFIPGFSRVSDPYRFVFLYVFSISILAGLGLDCATRQANTPRYFNFLLLLFFLGSITALIAFYLGKPYLLSLGERMIEARYTDPERRLAKLPSLYSLQLRSLAVFSLFSTLSGFILFWRRRLRRGFKALAICLALIDLWQFGLGFTYPTEVKSHSTPEYVRFLKGDSEPFRILPLDEGVFAHNNSILYRIPSVTGYDPLILKRYMRFLGASEDMPVSQLDPRCPTITNLRFAFLGLLNVKYIIGSSAIEGDFKLVYDKDAKIYENPYPLLKAFVVHDYEVLPPEQVLEELKSTSFNPERCVLLEEDPSVFLPKYFTPSEITILEYTPNSLTIKADASRDGFLVVSEVYYPGWRVYVDGREGKLYRANYILRAVYLKGGTHIVRFLFAPFSFKVGMWISVTSSLMIFALILKGRDWRFI